MKETNRQITKIAREVNKLVIKMMKEEGTGSGEVDLIHCIRHNPGISQKKIAEQLNIDKAAIARRSANLEKKGYLIRKENPNDKRSTLLYPTDKANELKNSKATIEQQFYDWLFTALEPQEKESFMQCLDKLYITCKKESREGFKTVLTYFNKQEWDNEE